MLYNYSEINRLKGIVWGYRLSRDRIGRLCDADAVMRGPLGQDALRLGIGAAAYHEMVRSSWHYDDEEPLLSIDGIDCLLRRRAEARAWAECAASDPRPEGGHQQPQTHDYRKYRFSQLLEAEFASIYLAPGDDGTIRTPDVKLLVDQIKCEDFGAALYRYDDPIGFGDEFLCSPLGQDALRLGVGWLVYRLVKSTGPVDSHGDPTGLLMRDRITRSFHDTLASRDGMRAHFSDLLQTVGRHTDPEYVEMENIFYRLIDIDGRIEKSLAATYLAPNASPHIESAWLEKQVQASFGRTRRPLAL
ncbi:hypothetical protein [Roseicella frigidaeris]|uniref:Uncharacterized protein n=1 Tax=Roseicella frigidaeris TaxID=2230885 RepID=A0A327MJ50_9PROT|nr:hypothetical protein [Roseicella frigidaeris]RAI60198.1 hypothetical protein DOO78_03710 [Roseicella frigidaeris]